MSSKDPEIMTFSCGCTVNLENLGDTMWDVCGDPDYCEALAFLSCDSWSHEFKDAILESYEWFDYESSLRAP